MIAAEVKCLDRWRNMCRALAMEWFVSGQGELILFAGMCACPLAQKIDFPQTSLQPVTRCHYCGGIMRLVPLPAYIGGNTWMMLEPSSDGGYTEHTVSLSQLLKAQCTDPPAPGVGNP